jgi:hypothetical protein
MRNEGRDWQFLGLPEDHSLETTALRLALKQFPIHSVCNVNKYLENCLY